MYGLVNRAVEDLLTQRFGAQAWERVRTAAGVDVGAFVAMSPYPDELTYALVAAASAELELPAEAVLGAFGEFWILYSAEQGYGELLAMMGDDLPSFVRDLDQMHDRLRMTFPLLRPPSLWVSDVDEGSLVVHYRSERDGLLPFVEGLMRGAARRLGRDVTTTVLRRRADGADHDELRLVYADLAAAPAPGEEAA